MPTTEITSANFEQHVARPGIVFLDFWAGWCGPCRTFAPIFEAAAEKHGDVTWGKVDTEAQGELAGAFGIQSIPTLMIFRDGVLVFARPGVVPAPALDEMVEGVRGLDMAEVRRQIEEEDKARAAQGTAGQEEEP